MALVVLALAPARASGEAPRRLLFAGNSYLGAGNPAVTAVALTRRIAELDGHPAPLYDTHIAGGATTSDHRYGGAGLAPMAWWDGRQHRGVIWESPVVQGVARWDAMVLQGQSLEATEVGDVPTFRANCTALAVALRLHSPQAVTLLHETWARPWGHPAYLEQWTGPPAMQQDIHQAYVLGVLDLRAALGPSAGALAAAGQGWRLGSWRSDARGLYAYLASGHVDHHAGSRGKLLQAFVIYRAIYRDHVDDILSRDPAGVAALLADLNRWPTGAELPLDQADWIAATDLAERLQEPPALRGVRASPSRVEE